MLASPLTQATGTVRLPSRHMYICMPARKLINANSHAHTIDTVQPNTNMPHRQNVLKSLCEGDRPVCEAVLERAFRFGTS